MWPFVILFLIMGLTLHFAGRAQERETRRARGWPVTSGKLERCEVVVSPDVESGQPSSWKLQLRYSYIVRERVYHATRYAIGYPESFDDAKHLAIVARLRALPELRVHYDPAKPGDAVLSRESYSGATSLGLFGLIMAGLSALLAIVLVCR
jgi:hypothetical protein